MKTEDVTAQILGAWEAIEEETAEPEAATIAPPEAEEPEQPEGEEPEGEEEAEQEEAEQEEEEETEESGEEAEEGEAEEEAPEVDVEVQAFLAKYGNDPDKALKGAAELQRLMGRRDQEKIELARRVEQLEAAAAQAQAFSSVGGYLSDEQREWVEAAVESPNPAGYAQQAIQAGEYELARALCREWAQVNPYEATRVGQFVDAVEYQETQRQAEPEPVPPATTWKALTESYPELRTYEGQMVGTLERLGPEHPLVQEARSTDPAQAVRGIFGIYEIAKASTFALSETRNGVKAKQRQAASDAIEAAVVTSSSNSPSAGETPRKRRLMPGLSEEDFEAAFAPPQ